MVILRQTEYPRQEDNMPASPQNPHRRPALFLAIACLAATGCGCTQHNTRSPALQPTAAVTVDGKVALASLITLSDGHLQKLADALQDLAASDTARSGKWAKIKNPLEQIAQRNVAAAYWFALPDGSYWTLDAGHAEGNLADRPYWPKVMHGQSVLGDLVVSKSTEKNVAIVAVPILRSNQSVAGVLGASVYLDKLSERLTQEMALDNNAIFYAVDATPKGALHHDTRLIFTEPKKLGAEMGPAFDEMLSHQEGIATYTFRGKSRTMLYRKSPVTGWWYAFGILKEENR